MRVGNNILMPRGGKSSRGAGEDPPATPDSAQDQSVSPVLVEGVQIWLLFSADKTRDAVYIIGQQDIDRYVAIPGRVLPAAQAALKFFDGTHSLQWISDCLVREERKRVDLIPLYKLLAETGLITSPHGYTVKARDVEAMTLPVADLKISGIAEASAGVVRIAAPLFALLSCSLTIIGGSLYLLNLHTAGYANALHGPRSGAGHSILFLSLLFLSITLHECSHGIAASYFGLYPRRLRVYPDARSAGGGQSFLFVWPDPRGAVHVGFGVADDTRATVHLQAAVLQFHVRGL
jgi:hypothetical protein